MEILKLRPAIKEYIWGGEKLKKFWNKNSETKTIAETWEFSLHKDGPCVISEGKLSGKTLAEVIDKETAGEATKKFEFFPVLIKLIDANDNLSVQVHPSDEYALKNEGQFGKTEMWYIAEADEGAGIYCGFKKEISREEFKTRIDENTLLDVLNFIPVTAGESYYIPSGTVHAIGKGVVICEIQQSSNLTYRVYDYNRKDAMGNSRELHIDKAVKVSLLKEYKDKITEENNGDLNLLKRCEYFTVYKGFAKNKPITLNADKKSFNSVIVLSGEGKVGNVSVKKGDSLFIPAGYGEYRVSGVEFILTFVE